MGRLPTDRRQPHTPDTLRKMRRGAPLRVPSNASPVFRRMVELRAQMSITADELEARSGVSARTIYRWSAGGANPVLGPFEAVLGALGYDLVAVPKKQPTEGARP